jgi:hypothetical protein
VCAVVVENVLGIFDVEASCSFCRGIGKEEKRKEGKKEDLIFEEIPI